MHCMVAFKSEAMQYDMAMLNYAAKAGDGNTAAFTADSGGQDDKSS